MIVTAGPYSDEVYGNAAARWDSLVVNLEELLRR